MHQLRGMHIIFRYRWGIYYECMVITCTVITNLVPRPYPQRGKRVWGYLSIFLVLHTITLLHAHANTSLCNIVT